ncbi:MULTISPECIES: DUF929 domain-containing protein [Metallosphaera]|uniref:DUF929 domain-containing protein n=3 Tax=Metallosphaera TaxID=41980 RepID=A4YFP9_METS5|nr:MULTISPECIES: DUF929 domain-containing protein [Metallosphaera]ABP95251.1 protein of unknown function DUF929 [Metallosphaera sedula DSM 5348]AIM27237.1 protein of unknown function DUF929 [Metallosphaera sedula]AKV74126.1 hypothetical protein MsedA_1100 [Metallosphaera sedula]AKV76366.1 hypothetical protein MsedB_1102 [Metallosphaera sedula]AKV78617.1 hypothetical protein MsedC_1100 [Metallosphaera sedula]
MNQKIIVAGISAVIALILILGSLPVYGVPIDTPFKVSSQQLTTQTCVLFISWYGCPYGATDSWPLYLAMSHYGKLNVIPNHSDPLDEYPNTSGLIFLNFTPNSTVRFKVIYLYNEYLNASANGTALNNYVNYGLQVIRQEAPWAYPLVEKYEVQNPASGEFFRPAVDLGSPSHIPSTIIISGGKGTYMIIGYLYSPSDISGYSPSQLMMNLTNIQPIVSSSQEIEGLL